MLPGDHRLLILLLSPKLILGNEKFNSPSFHLHYRIASENKRIFAKLSSASSALLIQLCVFPGRFMHCSASICLSLRKTVEPLSACGRFAPIKIVSYQLLLTDACIYLLVGDHVHSARPWRITPHIYYIPELPEWVKLICMQCKEFNLTRSGEFFFVFFFFVCFFFRFAEGGRGKAWSQVSKELCQ